MDAFVLIFIRCPSEKLLELARVTPKRCVLCFRGGLVHYARRLALRAYIIVLPREITPTSLSNRHVTGVSRRRGGRRTAMLCAFRKMRKHSFLKMRKRGDARATLSPHLASFPIQTSYARTYWRYPLMTFPLDIKRRNRIRKKYGSFVQSSAKLRATRFLINIKIDAVFCR